MSILEKVRDFFYDEEDDIEEVKKKPSKQPKEKKEKIKIIDKTNYEEEPREKQEISERELFKAERTFNFPFDVDEEDTKVEEKVEIKEEVKEKPYRTYKSEYKETKPLSIRNYTKYEKQPEEETTKKFKPTPVISPIYGILDKNYKKEDLLINDNKDITENKKLDYETVRKRAYSNVYNNVEEQSDSKGLFFNLDEEKENKQEDEVKIIYNDVEPEEEKEDYSNKTIGEKIEEYEKSLEDETKESDDENILSETKEQDLFNLIDNMYNSDDQDDDEEE